ncbi:hypothetical protein BUALT_Bualt09G0054300 [Buddleja alternifolia]|uniref:Uncharacterized protein n=1 Tax=Buddleja alternifolia TaxID=168488 RepID=A0AAV6X1M4_9LAMI|nr:hypothetical protein BUALT_Bualt09G0054300 [Buddleja alternifolia]
MIVPTIRAISYYWTGVFIKQLCKVADITMLSSFGNNASGGIEIEELPSVPENEERGLVLFKPMDTTPLLHSPSNFSISISPHLISGFKSEYDFAFVEFYTYAFLIATASIKLHDQPTDPGSVSTSYFVYNVHCGCDSYNRVLAKTKQILLITNFLATWLLSIVSKYNSQLGVFCVDQTLWSSRSNSWRLQNDEAVAEEYNSDSGDGCLAVVPWVPSQLPSADVPSHFDNYEMMDAEEEEETTKDVEESRDVQQRNDNEARGNDGVHQWQQQEHCMIPQFPHNTATPVFWYR